MAEPGSPSTHSLPVPAIASIAFALGVVAIVGWGFWIDHHAATAHQKTGLDDFATSRFLHGPWGDAFGPIAALFAATTMGMSFWSLHEQRRELADQRAELVKQSGILDESRSALSAQANALDLHTAALTKQASSTATANELAALRMLFDSAMGAASLDVQILSMPLKTPQENQNAERATEKSRAILLEMTKISAKAMRVAGVEVTHPHEREPSENDP